MKSPVVATQDAARRGLIERAKGQKQEVATELVRTFSEGEPVDRARALWVLQAIVGDAAAVDALKDSDPRIREQAVRMLGRDVRENGHVEYNDPAARRPPPAAAHLASLLPMAADPDAGVRRELILALRNLPTAEVGEALKTLTRTWDGRDRWYLEALGLALDGREQAFLAELFDGTLYGDLDLDKAGEADAGGACLPTSPPTATRRSSPSARRSLPASALSKTLGLAWRIHQPAVLPLLGRILPKLESPELQDGLDDVLTQIRDPKAAVVVAGMVGQADDPARKRQLLSDAGAEARQRLEDGPDRPAGDHGDRERAR